MLSVRVRQHLTISHKELSMLQGIRLVVYPVKDTARAKALYGRLLSEKPYADEPYYVGFRVGDLEIRLDPHGHSKGNYGTGRLLAG